MTSDTNSNQALEPTPQTGSMTSGASMEYVGFLPRLVASIIDAILMGLILMPIFFMVYGFPSLDVNDDFIMLNSQPGERLFSNVISTVIPALVILLFWVFRGATPGKMLFSAVIVDAETGGKPTIGQLLGRYASYFLSSFALGLGFLWVAFDKRSQGWHDKLAGTVVIKKR